MASSVRSVAKIKEHPYRSWRMGKSGSIVGLIEGIDEPFNIPRQELPEIFFQTGDIEAVRRETLLSGSVSGGNVYPLIMDHNEMIDIDSKSDFINAEKKLNL
jgi:N-acylneuraminate cytidylyltransferase